VVRDKFNYGRCRFRSGKEYDRDLSASYNIAARFFVGRARMAEAKAKQLAVAETGVPPAPAGQKTRWPVPGQRSGRVSTPPGQDRECRLRCPACGANRKQRRRETRATAARLGQGTFMVKGHFIHC